MTPLPSSNPPVTAASRWLPWAWFTLIILLAAALRLFRLGDLPPAIFRDEAEKALNAWFLLTSGTDASGRPWPIFIEVFGVTTSAIYQYATIPFLALGGLNEWTARLPAATVGIATVALTWAVTRHLWNWQTATWAALFLAVSSWHVPLSRWAQQGIFLPFFFTIATLGLAKFLTTDKPRTPWLALTAATIGLAMYTYDPARLFAPLLALVALVLWYPVWIKNLRPVLIATVIFLLFLSPVLWLLLTQSEAATARFRYLSIAQPDMPLHQVFLQFLKNYAAHFSLDFLLKHGDPELRHGAGLGVLNPVEFLFALLAAVYAIRRRQRWPLFFLCWIILAPVPASLTREGIPHALRTQLALPAWQILAAFGLQSTIELFPRSIRRRRIIIWASPALLLATTWNFCIIYFGPYAHNAAFNWQYGVKQSLQYLSQPTTQNSDVLFYHVTGAEYIVPFHLQMTRPEFRRMIAGSTRYSFAHHPTPMENWQETPPEAPRAIITPYGFPPIQGSYSVLIDAPQTSHPVMQINLSPALMEQIQHTFRNE